MGDYSNFVSSIAIEYKKIACANKFEKPKVSIIVPAYNVEKYIERCLVSLIKQTIKDIEIIVVDDGSTDLTPAIINTFASIDKRIIAIHQENSKQGAARNRGLEVAKGEYICFVDSDDWIDDDYCEKMYKAITKTNADLAISSAVRIKSNGKTRQCFTFFKNEIYRNWDITNIAIKTQAVWGILYKRNLLEDIFFEEGVYFEDIEYLIQVLHKAESMVTVPQVVYYWFSNPNSTMKKHFSIAKRQDQINSKIKLSEYVERYHIPFPEVFITKERHLLYTIKHFQHHKEIYILGVKICSIKKEYDKSKIFLVFNTSAFGDTLLCNSLCQNIKKIYPDSKVVFVANAPYADAARYQKDVDEVIPFDKRGKHKGVWARIKFILNFPYKKPFCSFVTYKNTRNFIFSKLIGAKHIVRINKAENNSRGCSIQERSNNLLRKITNKKVENLPIKYEVPKVIPEHLEGVISPNKKYIGLCTITKRIGKNIPIETAIKVINMITLNGYEVIYFGAGKNTSDYADNMRKQGCNFIDLTNKTTIPELGSVLQFCEALIAPDTGVMHMGYAVGTPVLAVYYEKDHLKWWAPDEAIYNALVLSENQTPENIFNKLNELLRRRGDSICVK